MKLVTFRIENNDAPQPGLSIDGKVAAFSAYGSIVDLLAAGRSGLSAARALEKDIRAGSVDTFPESDITLLAAIPNPPTIFLLAANYQSHITEGGGEPVDKSVITPRPFIKPGTAVANPGDSILIPPDSDTLDYEIEIAAVIGAAGRAIPVEDAEAHVAGYVVFNDVSARSLTISEGRKERNG